VGADVGLLAGGVWARSGVVKLSVASIRTCFNIDFSSRRSSGPVDSGASEPKNPPGIDDKVRRYRCPLAIAPVSYGIRYREGIWSSHE
jgi:hypothetical protein